MFDIFPPWPLLTAFLIASFVLAITPGPGVFYIVARTLTQGRKAGLASVAGVAVGNFGNAIGAAIGLAALFAISSIAFSIVKYAGAAYLIYLGIKTIRAPQAEQQQPAFHTVNVTRIFRDGFVVALLNPKTTIFFAAFLPQFMRPTAFPILQSISLGAMFVAIAAITDTVYALTASKAAPLLARLHGVRSVGRYLTASAFIGLGIFTAVGSRSGK